jgi:exopolysaccharide production protein ExoQ
MPPRIALLLGYALTGVMIRLDMKWRRAGSRALIIPCVWLGIQGSRPLSYWFNSGGGTREAEGNPINTLAFAILIMAAIVVLARRSLNWSELVSRNKLLFCFYFFFVLSAVWSEAPLTSVKRLFKDFGCVLVGLVILTEENPAVAMRAVFLRTACLLFTLSLVFGKFFPDIGRNYTMEGEQMFTGVTTQKNSLGETLFVFGLVILWDTAEVWKAKHSPGWLTQFAMRVGLLGLCLWLLLSCHSQTSLVCLLTGSFIFWGCHRLLRMQHGKRVLITCMTIAICLAALDKTFGLSEIIIKALGRNPTLTGRSDIWRLVLAQQDSPLLGNGFYTFWDGKKGQAVVAAFMAINSTHNGYVEMYVDGGLAAVTLLALLLLGGCGRVINRLFSGAALGKIGLVFCIVALIYNLSESSFFRLDVLWFTLLLLITECPAPFNQGWRTETSGSDAPVPA